MKTRREFMAGTLSAGLGLGLGAGRASYVSAGDKKHEGKNYRGPNVVIVRFGGGVRRRETIKERHTYAPYLLRDLVPRGTFYRNMEIDRFQDLDTSHGEGTLNILTGHYARYQVDKKDPFDQRFEAEVPTLFEYLRKTYDIPAYQTLLINGEDRSQEEFYNFSNHHLFGANFRSQTLSLFRYKTWLLEKQVSGNLPENQRRKLEQNLKQMREIDYRTHGKVDDLTEIRSFWEKWYNHYGTDGLKNMRGDRLLTELSLWSMHHLKPRLMMINFNDPDYVHWGNMNHYTEGIKVIDHGLRQLVAQTQLDPFYRDNTVFCVVPDCGRDTNPLLSVPCQHHFNSKSAHEIWCLLFGPGVEKGKTIDRRVDQTQIASTLGKLMGAPTKFADSNVLEEAIA